MFTLMINEKMEEKKIIACCEYELLQPFMETFCHYLSKKFNVHTFESGTPKNLIYSIITQSIKNLL